MAAKLAAERRERELAADIPMSTGRGGAGESIRGSIRGSMLLPELTNYTLQEISAATDLEVGRDRLHKSQMAITRMSMSRERPPEPQPWDNLHTLYVHRLGLAL